MVGLSILWLFFSWIAWRKARANGFSRAIVIGGIVFDIAVAAALAFYAPVSFGNAAVSADYASFTARPEWYILPLHQLLVLFQRLDPSFAWVGTMVVPGIVLLLVLLAPWIDVRARRGQASAYGPVFGVLLLAGASALFAMGWTEMASPAGPNLFAAETADAAVKLDPRLVAQGETIFKSQDCLTCHSMNGPSSGAPNLAGTGSRHPGVDWQVKHLMQPSSSSPGSTMPSYARLGQAKLKALASYLISLKG